MFNQALEEETVRRFSMTPAEMRSRHEDMLFDTVEKARTSPVYADLGGWDGLGSLPVTTHEHIAECMGRHGIRGTLLCEPCKSWHTSGYTGRTKEFHYSRGDVAEIAEAWATYAYLIGMRARQSSWNFGGKEPMLSGTVLEGASERLMLSRRLFTPLACDTDFMKALKRASRHPPPDIMAGTPLIYYLIGKVAEDPEYLYRVVRDKVREYYHTGPLSGLVARAYLFHMDHANIRRIVSEASFGISYSEPISPYLEGLRGMYPRMRFHDVLGSTENPIIAGQISPDHQGLAMMLSRIVPEIVPPEEVRKAGSDRSHRPEGRPWWEWKRGMVGELLLTRPGECLPLVRYATGDVVEVIDPAKTFDVELERSTVRAVLPVIRVLSRSVDVLDYEAKDEMGNFLGNKIYTRHVNDVLLAHPRVRWWELYNVKGCPGRLVMLVFPLEKVDDPDSFRSEMRKRLVKDTDDPLSTFRVANDLDRLEVVIAAPEAYDQVQREIDRRAREGRSLGQLKPKHIHVMEDEQELRDLLEHRFGSVLERQ